MYFKKYAHAGVKMLINKSSVIIGLVLYLSITKNQVSSSPDLLDKR